MTNIYAFVFQSLGGRRMAQIDQDVEGVFTYNASRVHHPCLTQIHIILDHNVSADNGSHDTPSDQDYQTFYDVAQFVTGLILYPIICFVGITGNILTLVVLSRPKMATSTNVFLIALAAADLIKLLNDTLYFIVSILMRTSPIAGNEMMGYMYPFSHYIFNESVCVASWLTVCVGIERYIYVCHASKVRQWCTISRNKAISGAVFVVMSLVAVPSALRYKRISVWDSDLNRTMFEIELTELGRDPHFSNIYIWFINLLRSVIPLCLLVVLNCCIITSLRKQKVKGKVTGKKTITFMLIIVIVVFLVCVTPDAIMSTVFGFGYVEANNLVKGIREFTDTLLAVNSAANFIVYCLCSVNFRNTFYQIFFRHPHKHGDRDEESKFIHSQRPHNGDSPTLELRGSTNDVLHLEEKPFAHVNHITMYHGPQQQV